jgi:hypothetical protein
MKFLGLLSSLSEIVAGWFRRQRQKHDEERGRMEERESQWRKRDDIRDEMDKVGNPTRDDVLDVLHDPDRKF